MCGLPVVNDFKKIISSVNVFLSKKDHQIDGLFKNKKLNTRIVYEK